MSSDITTYHYIRRGGQVTRTIEIDESTQVDVDADGRILGIEGLPPFGVNWMGILADDRFRFVGGDQP